MVKQVHKLGCDDCGSSDAVTMYEDGHTHCFSCNKTRGSNNRMSNTITNFSEGLTMGLKDRNISEATCKKFGVTVVGNSTAITKHIYPYHNREGVQVANKIRTLPKAFAAEGAMNNNVALFGQDKFDKGGRAITIFEGELDALAGYELTGSMYPCVSLPNGAAGAVTAIKHNLEYLESFEKIVLCFDNDEAGKKAIADVVPLFSYGKCRIMKLERKDACDYIKETGHEREFQRAWFNASVWTPDGIVCSSDMLERILNRRKVESIEYPWAGLNALTYGIRKNELVMFTAMSGRGKTQLLREVISHIHAVKPEAKIGTLFLEEEPEDTTIGLMSVDANIPYHIPDAEYTEQQFIDSFNKVHKSGNFFFYENFGEYDIDKIINRIRYYVKGLDCEYIVLDHLSIVVSGGENGDERRALDEIATKLKTLTIELGICILAVVHLNRQGQIRGTAGVEQLSNMVIHLERDVTHENAVIRNTTTVTVWKNRFAGKTGIACYLKYDELTGRMIETTKPEEL